MDVFCGFPDDKGHRVATSSATSCQCEARRFPRRSEYHLSRYASISAAVSSWDQHGGGRRREDAVEVCGGAARRRDGGFGGSCDEEGECELVMVAMV